MSFGDVGLMLLVAANAGDIEMVEELLKQGVPASFRDDEKGQTALMLAAASGSKEVVQLLLERGAPWNDVDNDGRSAGDYALKRGKDDVVQVLVNAGVSAELLFATMENKSGISEARSKINNTEYIKRHVQYEGNDLIDYDQRGVMMMWEKPLMKAHAEFICRSGGDVINFGFGLGLVDTAIQKHNPRTHTIVEAHPDVYKKMLADGWGDKPNVRIIHSRWQDALDDLGQYDGIFFDTFDDVLTMHEFHVHLPKLLKRGGVYTFFNGICPESVFLHSVACEVLKVQLEGLGFATRYHKLSINCANNDIWKNVKFRYFESNTYNFPIVWWATTPPENEELLAPPPDHTVDENGDEVQPSN
eukprot:m.40401 g.40401  ORF g.40401 m.40401 type:complete len:359 (-) comp6924_c0_seq1:839-1915(-)